MSALSINWLQALPFAVLGTSLLGSGHCVAMCGGLVLGSTKNAFDIALYHLGRLMGYCALGAAAGLLGSQILGSQAFSFLPIISSILIAASFIFLGIRTWYERPVHLFRLPKNFYNKYTRSFGTAAFPTGLLSAALPCGWLHGFVLGAIATQSALQGALYLLFFWIGTLPALSLAPITIQKIFKPMAAKIPKISAILLILIGLATLGVRLKSANFFQISQEGDECPMHESHSHH